MANIKVDTPLVAALGLMGLGLYGLGVSAGRSRSDDLAREIEELDDRFKEHVQHSANMRLALMADVGEVKSKLSREIIELEERLASRVWELEKRAGLAPKEGDPDVMIGLVGGENAD
ncbi:MAG: hypothetical protein ACPG4T_16465 [Nannocystaceae bacterium]